MGVFLLFQICLLSSASAVSVINVRIQTDRIVSRTEDDFVAMAIDSGIIRKHWERFDPRSAKVQTLARGLSPCYLRIGGTDADFLIFDPQTSTKIDLDPKVKVIHKRDIGLYNEYGNKNHTNYTMTAQMFDEVIAFSSSVGWNIIFDLNVLLRANGGWDSTNAMKLLKYTAEKGYHLAGWELGNEPNAFYRLIKERVEPEQLASDFRKLRSILNSFPEFQRSLLIGPSTTQLHSKRVDNYFKNFLDSGGGKAVTEATFHFYYLDGREASVSDFLDPVVMNSLQPEIQTAYNISNQSAPGLKVWLGETSSAYGGGAPGISDSYASGFLWMNTMGVSARRGIGAVVRQTFYGGHYSVLDSHSLDPNPDYWLILLYRRLVGPKVLGVTSPYGYGHVRVYAHCTSERSGYKSGSVVVYFMNSNAEAANLTFPDIPNDTDMNIYMLEPHNGKLTAREVLLNGKILKLQSDTELPPLSPRIQKGPVLVPAHSFGFVVLTGSAVEACL